MDFSFATLEEMRVVFDPGCAWTSGYGLFGPSDGGHVKYHLMFNGSRGAAHRAFRLIWLKQLIFKGSIMNIGSWF